MPDVQVDKKRLKKVASIKLESGSHQSLEAGACVMELVSFVAGEPWSDHPKCTSPVLAAFARRFNDLLDDEGRQKLKPYIARLIGTAASKDVEQARGWMAADWCVRHASPAWLELAGLKEQAELLRSMPEITKASYKVHVAAIRKVRGEAWEARSKAFERIREKAGGAPAAYAAAAAAAAYAADAAAYAAADADDDDAYDDAAYAAAAADAADADADAAYAAAAADAYAYAAKHSKVWTEVYTKVKAAIGAKLEPTKLSLQAASFDLLDRMIAVGTKKSRAA